MNMSKNSEIMISALNELKNDKNYKILINELERVVNEIETTVIFNESTNESVRHDYVLRRNSLKSFIELSDDLIRRFEVENLNTVTDSE